MVPAADGSDWIDGIYGGGLGLSGPPYYACLWVALLAATTVARHAGALGPRVVWTAIGVGVVAFALAPPLLSQDAFSYISYARMSEIYGASPYEFAPAELPYDQAFPYVGWPFAASAYGPAFTLAALPLGHLSVPVSFWILKGVAAVCALGIAALTAAIARRREIEPLGAAAFVALNPITLVHVVGGAHNDALMVMVSCAAVLALLAGRELLAGAGFAAAAAVKLTGGIVAPFALVAARRKSSLVVGGLLVAATVTAATVPLFGSSALQSIGVLGDNQDLTTRLSLPRIVSNLPLPFGMSVSVDAARVAAAVAYVGFLVWLLLWTWRGADWVRAAGWATLGLLLATSWILPWYLLWVLPLAAVANDRPLRLATLALCGLQLAFGIPWP